jgi:hypothetical protein
MSVAVLADTRDRARLQISVLVMGFQKKALAAPTKKATRAGQLHHQAEN